MPQAVYFSVDWQAAIGKQLLQLVKTLLVLILLTGHQVACYRIQMVIQMGSSHPDLLIL